MGRRAAPPRSRGQHFSLGGHTRTNAGQARGPCVGRSTDGRNWTRSRSMWGPPECATDEWMAYLASITVSLMPRAPSTRSECGAGEPWRGEDLFHLRPRPGQRGHRTEVQRARGAAHAFPTLVAEWRATSASRGWIHATIRSGTPITAARPMVCHCRRKPSSSYAPGYRYIELIGFKFPSATTLKWILTIMVTPRRSGVRVNP